MPTIGWNENEPSDSSGANTGASEIRSLKSNLAGGLSGAIYWPGSGGASAASAGQPVPGAWRAFYGAQSLVSAYADGAMYVTSDTSRLFGIGSSGTMFIGGAQVVEGPAPGAQNARWVMAAGVSANGSAFSYGSVMSTTTGAAVLSPLTYNGLPVVTFSLFTSALTVAVGYVQTLGTGSALVQAVYNGGGAPPASSFSVYWQSFGTVTF